MCVVAWGRACVFACVPGRVGLCRGGCGYVSSYLCLCECVRLSVALFVCLCVCVCVCVFSVYAGSSVCVFVLVCASVFFCLFFCVFASKKQTRV